MPTIKYNKRALLELIGKKISDEALVEKILFLGTAVDGISDTEITVEVFPNRPDLLSEHGMARALKTFLDIKSGFAKYDVKKSGIKVVVDKSVKNIRPYTACAVVKGLKLSDEKIKEIITIQEKLHGTYCRNRKKTSIGIYPLEHIRPPIYYKALHPEEIRFKPLDMNKDLAAPQILAIHPTGREYAHLLEGKEKYPVFMDSKQNIMSLVPIINSNTVGKVTLTTKDVFVECSGFEFDYVHTCLNMIVTALSDMGGSIYSVDISYPEKKYVTPDLSGKEMKLEASYVKKILGIDLKESDIKKLLGRMGHDYKGNKALSPNYRSDMLHPIDLVEDIAIAYGYQNFNGTQSNFSSRAQERPIELFKNKLRDTLIGLGLIEVKNYHLTNKNSQSKLMNHDVEVVELENSVNQDYDVLRAWLTPCLMETLKSNKHYDYPQNIFEVGTVFKIDSSSDYSTGVQENDRLAVMLCGNNANFTAIKQMLDALMESIGQKYELTDTDHGSFIKGRTARVVVSDSKVAYIGEMHPKILANWGIEMPVSVFEINVSELFRKVFNKSVYFEEAKVEKNGKAQTVITDKPKSNSKTLAKPAKKTKPVAKKSGKKKK